jgi:adenylate kinase family enzyme
MLCQHFGLKHIELDEFYWLPGWKERDADEFAELVKQATPSDNWVMDGNYDKLFRCFATIPDLMIWLDYPLYIVIWRCIKRSVWRIISRENICNGNRESLRQQLTKDGSILYWVLTTYRIRRQQLKEYKLVGHIIIEFKHPKDVNALINNVMRSMVSCPDDRNLSISIL